MDAGGRTPTVGALGDAGAVAEQAVTPTLASTEVAVDCLTANPPYSS